MDYESITKPAELQSLCERLANEDLIGFDTEFVSEDSFFPDLCLIQVAAGDVLAVIDTKVLEDIAPFWKMLAEGEHETIVHAAREEFLFCLRATGRRPHGLLDLQLAAGMVGIEYPAALGTLISRLIGKTLPKGETRTDWRRRPLSSHQIEYALQDVLHLEALREAILERLDRLNRLEWFREESVAWQDALEATQSQQRWRRVSGISGLSARSLAIVRELWMWRDEQARQRNVPAKRVLRDDLIVELARRRTADTKRIRAVRGLQHTNVRSHIQTLAQRIQQALDLPEGDLPQRPPRDPAPQLTVLGQFLSTALGSICRRAHLAPALVGTVQDVRDLIAYRLDLGHFETPPKLASGWRAEVVGQVIDDLLRGRTAIRIEDPLSEQPLVFQQWPEAE